MKLEVIYLWQEQGFFWFLPGNRINHSTKSMPTLHSIVFYWQKIVQNMEYIWFCTLISSIMNCCIGANHVKVSHGVWIHIFLKTSTEKRNWIKVHWKHFVPQVIYNLIRAMGFSTIASLICTLGSDFKGTL